MPPSQTSRGPLRLGLYGGSFDPVHLGHVLVAQTALEELRLDRLFLIPATQSPFKPASTPVPGDTRARLLRLAFAGFPRVELDDQELRRGGVSYSIDTARAYAGRHPGAELYWLIGADHVPALPRWRDADALASLVQFVVIPRPPAPGHPPDPAPTLPPPFRLLQLRGFPIALSSSQIRDRLRDGLPCDPLLPSAVAEAIRTDSLYRSVPGA